MRNWTNAAVAGALGVLAMVSAGTVRAAEITILTGQGIVSAVRDVAPAFERASGHKVVVSFEGQSAMASKLASNAPADIVMHYPHAIDDLIKQGKVVAGSKLDFARAGIGVAVKAGAAKPDLSSADAFKRALLGAKSIAYSKTGASGLSMARLIERLGLADALRGKTTLVEGVPVAQLVAKGEVELGMQQINVILPVAGIDYAGPLPLELQDYVEFSAGLLAVSKEPAAAKAMLGFMATPAVEPLIRKSGMEPMVR